MPTSRLPFLRSPSVTLRRRRSTISSVKIPAHLPRSYPWYSRLLSRLLVVMRLVAPIDTMEPAPATRRLVATLCGMDDWQALLAAVDQARQRIAARWAGVRDEA